MSDERIHRQRQDGPRRPRITVSVARDLDREAMKKAHENGLTKSAWVASLMAREVGMPHYNQLPELPANE